MVHYGVIKDHGYNDVIQELLDIWNKVDYAFMSEQSPGAGVELIKVVTPKEFHSGANLTH
jgi:hypothetical protein